MLLFEGNEIAQTLRIPKNLQTPKKVKGQVVPLPHPQHNVLLIVGT